jgi:anti-sigma regulatory factor (Ser/Thr protein kinase)
MRQETWLPATPASAGSARRLVREAAAAVGLEGEPTWDLMLAATEAVTNAVQHGEPWPNDCVLFTTEPCPRGLRVEVCDLGAFDGRPEPAAIDATCGRGLQIIAALVDRFEVRNGDGRTRVRFEKHRVSSSPGGNRELEREVPSGRVKGAVTARPAIHDHVLAEAIAVDAGGARS